MNTSIQKPKNSIIVLGIILLLAFLLALSLMGSAPILNLFKLDKVNATYFFISRLMHWVCLFAIMLYAVKVEKQNLLIWTEKKYTILIFIVSVIALLAAFFIGNIITGITLHFLVPKEKSNAMGELMNIFRTNIPLYIFTALTAGVCEELIFRGYLQPRLQILFKSPAAAIIISSLLFGLMHYRYGTIINMIGPFVIGLATAIYYSKYRNIKVPIVCHFLWDLAAIYILMNHH